MAASRPDDLTLFGVDELEAEETYLVWADLREPKVATYVEGEEQIFRNFRDYLSFLTAR